MKRMKIVHTSDWHIGQNLYQYSRDEEHKHFFNQLKDIILEENPDVLLISGDVFHTATPTVLSQRLYYHTLVELSRLYDDMQIIVVAGNHDSPSRLEAPRELWEAFNVTVVGNLDFFKNAEDDGLSFDASKIEVPVKRNNEIIGWVLAVPYINAGNYPSLEINDSYSNRVFNFYNNLKNNLKQNSQYKEIHSIIATGHFMINGVDLKGHEKIVGGIESVDATNISSLSDIDYWAFGHIHRPQMIAKNKNMRYSGSPFAMNFSEDYQHSVAIVEINNHKSEVRLKTIDPLIPVVDFPSKPKSYDDAITIEEIIPKLYGILDRDMYVRLHVKSELPLTDVINAKLLDMFRDNKARYCGIQVYLPNVVSEDFDNTVRTLDEFKSISPFDLGCAVYKKKNNLEMPEKMKKIFKEICDEMSGVNN